MEPVIAMARSIRITEEPALEQQYPGKFVADVTVTLKDGRAEHVFLENPIGTDRNPMPEQEQDAKFMELTADTLGVARAQKLLSTLRALDPATRTSALTDMWAM